MAPTPQTARARYARNRKIASFATLFALLALIAGALAIAGNSDGDGTSTATSPPSTTLPVTTTTIDPSKLSPIAQELYALIQQGRTSGYHVVYAISGSGLPPTTISASLEVWRSGALVRHDTRVADPSGEQHTIDIGGPTGAIECSERPGPSYDCRRASTTPVGKDSDFLGFVLELLVTASIESRADTVANRTARCYRFVNTESTAELCLTEGGIPLRVNTGGFVEEATLVEETVDPSAFNPPVPVP